MILPVSTFVRRTWRIALFTLAVMTLYYLLTRHGAHTFSALPYLLILACPLMHLLGHRKGNLPHRHHDAHDGGSQQ